MPTKKDAITALEMMPMVCSLKVPAIWRWFDFYLPQSKRLLEQVSEVLRYKHYSLKTEQAYVYWVRFLFAGVAEAESAQLAHAP